MMTTGTFRAAVVASLVVTAAGVSPALAQQQRPPIDLAEMSLEELLTIEVTSAGKKSQLIGDTAAAIYVITSEDIRRSNAMTVMELLRQVPGMHVAREATGKWSIGIRGFTSENSNKLLVLIDGRTLYTPVYTGVEWKVQDTLLDDVDRIEVIRGPGASLWGANAVNGVINIITKSASDTQGAMASFQTGALENGTVAARYGGSLGSTAHFRVFSKYFNRKSLQDADGATPWGGWDSVRQGGRVDWAPTSRDQIMLSSEWLINNVRELDEETTPDTFPFDTPVEERDRTKGAFVLGRWTRRQASGGDLSLQVFYDRNRLYDAGRLDRDEWVETTDVEFQHHLALGARRDVVWGGGVRQVRDRIRPSLDSWFTPGRFTARTYNAFLQNEAAWRENRLRFTAGSKLEWNDFSGIEVQPTARLLWTPASQHSFWTAASRAVRVPSRFEVHQYSIEEPEQDEDGIAYDLIVPPHSFKPERVTAYEAGYRFLPSRRFSLDVSTFHNVYTDLQTIERGEAAESLFPVRGVMTQLTRTNAGYGKTYGAEVLGFWTISDALQLSGSYTRLQMRLDPTGFPHNEDGERMDELYAPNMFFVRAYTDLPHRIELNGELRYVGAVPGAEVGRYLEGNIHASREIRRGLRLNVTVENVLHGRHGEWDEGELTLPRGVRAGFAWRF
jgi:iron complex outermembrane recepter protein